MTPQTSKSSRVRSFKPRTAGGALGGILGAVAMSAIAGVLVTAAVTPVVAVGGVSASSAIDIFEKLPNHLNPGKLAEPSTLYAKGSNGKYFQFATFYDQDRETVDWNQISQYAKDAAVGEEDPRFYTHGGVDLLATGRAVLQNAAGKNLSGASTITMQYVRNVLIQEAISVPGATKEEQDKAYEAATKQDAKRKLQEMRYAISIEKQYPKDDILLGYLNIALFGRQIYGIESAAKYYYSTSAKDLTLPQAASLIAIVNNPSQLQIDIEENIPANEKRRNKILDSMLSHGKITEAQHKEAVATPVEPKITPRVQGCNVAEQKYGLGHFCDYVQRYIKQDPQFGETPVEREFNFARGGYKIYTTIDTDMQKAGNDSMRANVPSQMEGIDVGGASVSTEVGTGRVLAMVQNKPFNNAESFLKKNPGYTTINYNTDFEYGGSTGFQVGSTFKPITLAEWIRTGHSVNQVVNMNSRSVQESSLPASCMPDGVYGFGSFSFTNDNEGTKGNRPVLTAITNSVNGGIMSMQQGMDLCGTMETAQKLGLHRASDQPIWTKESVAEQGVSPDLIGKIRVPTLNQQPRDLSMVPSNVYGGIDEMAPITMALAYGAFAGDGTVCKAVPIDKIVDSDGENVAFTKGDCSQALAPEVAAGVAYALNYNVNAGPLVSHARSAIGTPHLAKTGTTDDVIDNWTVGSSSKVSTATWVGNAGPVKRWDGTYGRVTTLGMSIQTADTLIWPAMMNVADAKYGGDAFPEPDASALVRPTTKVPDVKGKTFEEAQQMLTQVGFTVSDGGEVASSVAKGKVAKTDPAGGESADTNSAITVYRSNGKSTKVPGGLVGSRAEDAQDTLRSAGFSKIATVCENGNDRYRDGDKVVSVSPDSGAEASPESTITISLNCKKG